MIQVGGHGEDNPNVSWLGSRGMWFTYVLVVAILHLFILSIPLDFLTTPLVWTITTLIHNASNFIFLHVLKGAPWEVQDQGLARRLTHWEQIDYGVQFTRTRKFLTIVPILLFFLASFYTKYDTRHFVPNFVSMMLVLIPKLPQFHCVRLFGINKY